MRVSVVIPAYNAAQYLRESVESALDQAYLPEEILVIDDGSTDGTHEVAGSFGSPRVRCIRQVNSGEAAARNRGLAEAKGDLVAYLDADDRWLPTKLAKQVQYLEQNPDAVAVGCGYRELHGQAAGAAVEVEDAVIRRLGPAGHFFGLPSSVWIGTLLVRVAARAIFPVGVRANADVMYMTMLASIGPIGAIDEVLCFYRKHPSQITASKTFPDELLDARLKFAHDNLNLLGFRSEDEATAAVYTNMIHWLQLSRWRRDMHTYRTYRKALNARWPSHLISRPHELTRWIPPTVVLQWLDKVQRMVSSPSNRSRIGAQP